MNLTPAERKILYFASEDYNSLFEFTKGRAAAEAGIRGLLSKGLIALYRSSGWREFHLVPEIDHEASLMDERWDPNIESEDFIVFTTTKEGDIAYQSGAALEPLEESPGEI